MLNKGKVYIIGAGPGDYRLLTLKAVECIGMADVVVYDRLIGSQVLNFAKDGAEFIYVGKAPDNHTVPQGTINKILLDKASEGKCVARVKGGDPFVFGRGGEEAEFLRENGIEFEVVPGVTSAVAAPAYAGIPVTHRDCCSSLHIITGHEKSGKEDGKVDYAALARLEGTLVFLMGVRNIKDIADNLLMNGKPASTPAAVVENGTTACQRKVEGTLEDIAQKAKESGVRSPAVLVIGKTAELGKKLDWFPKGKLAGKRVLITRPRRQAAELAREIEGLGGESLVFPLIKIAPPEDFSAVDKVLAELKKYSWVVFTSVNGVEAFFNRMKYKGMDIRELAGLKICAVGEATGEELADRGIRSEFVPENYTTRELLKGLLERIKLGERILLARADIANPELSEGLRERNIDFDEVAVYRTLPDESRKGELLELLHSEKIDFITFTSSSTVKNFHKFLKENCLAVPAGARVVCIGPVTAKTARDLDIRVDGTADVYTIEGLVEKLVQLAEG